MLNRTKYRSQASDMGFGLEQLCQLGAVIRGVTLKLPAQTLARIRRLGLGTQPITARGKRADCRKQRPLEFTHTPLVA